MSNDHPFEPPAEHRSKQLHWIQAPDGSREVWFWAISEWFRYRLEQSAHPTWTRFLERLFDRPGDGNDPYLAGYRYLGPAEYHGGPSRSDEREYQSAKPVMLESPRETFRQFYERTRGYPISGINGEPFDTAFRRLTEALVDWADLIADRKP